MGHVKGLPLVACPNVAQKAQNLMVGVLYCKVRVENEHMGAVLIQNPGSALYVALPLIYRQPSLIVILGADKDDVALAQVLIVRADFQRVPVYATLIVSYPLLQSAVQGRLNLHVIFGVVLILKVHIQTDSVGVILVLEVLLLVDVDDLCNGLAQQRLQKRFDVFRLAHNF